MATLVHRLVALTPQIGPSTIHDDSMLTLRHTPVSRAVFPAGCHRRVETGLPTHIRPCRSVARLTAGVYSVAVLALLAAGCDKMPLTAPTDSQVVLFASSTVMPLNGSVEITATVLEPGGIPVHNGTQVNFVTTLGVIEPAEARTSGGRATVRLRSAGTSGIARVSAFSGGASAEGLEVRVGASAATRISLSADVPSLPPGGGVTQILAVVTDDENRRLEGVPVTFSANAGALRDTTVVTNINGEARTQLTATRETIVTATVGSATATLTVRVTSEPIITLTTPSTSVGEGENVVFTVGVQVGANGDPIRDVTIDFGDGETLSLGPVSGTRTVSHVFRRAGTYRVEVAATDTGGVTARAVSTITVEHRAIPVTLVASPSATPRINTPVTFTATATGTNITGYWWDFGDGTSRFTTGASTIHTYGSLGRKFVRVDVVNAAGQRGENVIEVVVQP